MSPNNNSNDNTHQWPPEPCDRPSQTDLFATGPWPSFVSPLGAVYVFQQDTGCFGYDLYPGWAALSEEQKEAYRARAEARRREAWGGLERALARRAGANSSSSSPSSSSFSREQQQVNFWGNAAPPELIRARFPGLVRRRPVVPVSGFELYRDELVARAEADDGRDGVLGGAEEVGGFD
jgi:hypothetical protein